MGCDIPCVTYVALYILSSSIISTNTRSATHWRLVNRDGVALVEPVIDEVPTMSVNSEDPVLSILAQKYGFGEASERAECVSCEEKLGLERNRIFQEPDDPLFCTPHANSTDVDHLDGIKKRNSHVSSPEPDVAMIFKKTEGEEIDVNTLETNLRELITNNPESLSVLNQVGNFWRIKGNTRLAIECFRKALYVSPHNPDILLNLARVFYNLNYLNSSWVIAQQSLELKSCKGPDRNAWLQHYTLGEIHKAMGNVSEASDHFRHALELNPGLHQAELHLRQMDEPILVNVTVYTIVIILVMMIGVCVGLYITASKGKSASRGLPLQAANGDMT
ncbi:tetratricopeptide repeat protein 17-like [Anneissia japonica]|uniref:tetratricopeptide repeat protein 17-like n=1 Tax=Anneissia japonica TaxID=1529436 RepID=UPI00142595C2|nr:tetratricopeptide repeat protein 17-like [Anneissia japonica]